MHDGRYERTGSWHEPGSDDVDPGAVEGRAHERRGDGHERRLPGAPGDGDLADYGGGEPDRRPGGGVVRRGGVGGPVGLQQSDLCRRDWLDGGGRRPLIVAIVHRDGGVAHVRVAHFFGTFFPCGDEGLVTRACGSLAMPGARGALEQG